jgi:hypothetical protein
MRSAAGGACLGGAVALGAYSLGPAPRVQLGRYQ